MNNHIIMTILFILVLWAGLGFWWTCMISQETREKILQKLHRKKNVAETVKEKGEEKPKKKSSSSTSEKNNDVLVAIIYVIVVLAFLIFLGKMGYKIIDTLPAISSAFGESMKVTVKEKPEWLYCHKGKFENEEECGWRGNIYKVRNFDNYIFGEDSSFRICWKVGCTDFRRDIDSSSTGTYRNRNTREEGRYSELKEVESELYTKLYTAKVVCNKSCPKSRDSFIIFKK